MQQILTWSEDQSIGVPRLDEEHKELLSLYNAIVVDLNDGCQLSSTRKHIKEFLERARGHFAAEEQFMHEIGYPDYLSHKGHHDKLVMDAENFLQSIGIALFKEDCPAIATYFKFWLLRHFENEDRKIGAFVRHHQAAGQRLRR